MVIEQWFIYSDDLGETYVDCLVSKMVKRFKFCNVSTQNHKIFRYFSRTVLLVGVIFQNVDETEYMAGGWCADGYGVKKTQGVRVKIWFLTGCEQLNWKTKGMLYSACFVYM